MSCSADQPHALEGIRVLEFSGIYGGYCGKLFADLGAEVILVEPFEGSPLRSVGPLDNATKASLPFSYQHTNKKSITLDLTSSEGQSQLKRLVKTTDLVILADHPEKDFVSFDLCREINPELICTRISPFGNSGPYSNFVADDLTLMAMGGFLYLGGYADSTPTVAYGEQAYRAGDQFAAVASLSALLGAEMTETGEEIDVSIQECVILALENAAQVFDLEGRVRKRNGGEQGKIGSGIFKCKDGEIYLLANGLVEDKFSEKFVEWLESEGVEEALLLREEIWSDKEYLESAEGKKIFNGIVEKFTTTRTKAELYEGAIRWRVPMAPLSTTKDVLESGQLEYRGFFVHQPSSSHADGIAMPGAPYKFSETPWQVINWAPDQGQHNDEYLFDQKDVRANRNA